MTADQHRLYDPRVHAYRDDLADSALKELINAAHYVEGELCIITTGVADMRNAPDDDAGRDSQALRGEQVRVFDVADGWAWGQLQTDGYVGYLPAAKLSNEIITPTHEIGVVSSFIYPEANMKHPNAEHVSFGERFEIVEEGKEYSQIKGGGYIYSAHLREIARGTGDPIAEAEKFVGVPYLWGGRSGFGVDCSGLVQLACLAAGISAPRDSDMMEAYLGTPLDHMDTKQLQAGDLIFWKGHTGLMVDGAHLLHANGHHMQTVVEPVEEAISRIAYMYDTPTSFRRLF